MSITIYESTPSGLYATGDRTVSTFPSGLLRVDQTFVCRTSAAATHRATLAVGADMPGESAPAIDGLKIFPVPQEKHRDDGFTEFVVSGYGRCSTSSLIDPVSETYYLYKNGLANIGTQEEPDVVSFFRSFEAKRVTYTVITPKGAEPPLVDIPTPILKSGPQPGSGYPPFNLVRINQTAKTNFGAFDECVTTSFYS